jgi:hypothetical protein
MARPLVADVRDGLQICGIVANILNKQSRTADKGWSSSLGVGLKNPACSKMLHRVSNLGGFFEMDLWAWGMGVWIGFLWLRIGTSGGVL